jgi:hypothetical protein
MNNLGSKFVGLLRWRSSMNLDIRRNKDKEAQRGQGDSLTKWNGCFTLLVISLGQFFCLKDKYEGYHKLRWQISAIVLRSINEVFLSVFK